MASIYYIHYNQNSLSTQVLVQMPIVERFQFRVPDTGAWEHYRHLHLCVTHARCKLHQTFDRRACVKILVHTAIRSYLAIATVYD